MSITRYVPGGAMIMSEAELVVPPEPVALRDRSCFNCPRPQLYSCQVNDPDSCNYLNPAAQPKRKHEPTGIEASYSKDPNGYQQAYRQTAAAKTQQAEYRRAHKEQRNQRQRAWRARIKAEKDK